MKIIAVDDEELALEYIIGLLEKVEPDATIHGFGKAREAIAFLSTEPADVAILDIEMAGMTGIELALKCKEACPKINIIFATGYSQYAIEALRLHASGYLLKPVEEADLRQELQNLRNPLPPVNGAVITVQTFGNFEIFKDGKLLDFPRTKCKECMAYLIDRKGAEVTIGEMAGILWEDKPYDRTILVNLQKIISDLRKTLQLAGVGEVLLKRYNSVAIDPKLVDCDYYRALNGDVAALNTFAGEYMSQYSWAEFTAGHLSQLTGV